MNILEKIVADTRKHLPEVKREVPLKELEQRIAAHNSPLDFAAALRGNGVKIIAEIKRASPSRGSIRPDLDAVQTALCYARNGASAISVLTEPFYFKGSLDDLAAVRDALHDYSIPLLRKDFLFDPYQVYQARAYGADCILLIIALLDLTALRELIMLSRELGMDCLVEVHNETELAMALEADAEIIGINNRDLSTFRVDMAVTERLRPLISDQKVTVSESGIKERRDIERMRLLGIDAVLVGELLVSASDTAAKLKELL